MNDNDQIRKSYDEIPYDSFPYAGTHPDRMGVVGRLCGLNTASATRCRVLELGCAGAGNLIPMAQSLSESEFVGIDLSPKQIEKGAAVIHQLGLSNIQLRAQSIMDFPADAGSFDYIIAHGMYSWVPDEVRDQLLKICAKHLAPAGVCFISCKTFPGWHLNNVLRDMMRFHTAHHGNTTGPAMAAREILEFAVSAFDNPAPQSVLVRQMANNLLHLPEMYLSHDHLSSINHPVKFEDFAVHIQSHGLQYLGHADPLSDNLWRMPPAWQQKIEGWAATRTEKEQYVDFLCWRSIRANILCRADATTDKTVGSDAIANFHLAARPVESATGDFRSPVKFSIGDRFITVGDSAVIHAVRQLKNVWPYSRSFNQLVDAIPPESRGDAATLHQRLTTDLFSAYRLSLLELWTRPVDFLSTSNSHPRVSGLVRWQAQRSAMLTTLRHEMFNANDAIRRLVPLMDGTRDIAALKLAMPSTAESSQVDQLLQVLGNESLLLA